MTKNEASELKAKLDLATKQMAICIHQLEQEGYEIRIELESEAYRYVVESNVTRVTVTREVVEEL